MTIDPKAVVGIDDLTPELLNAATQLGAAMARFENALNDVKRHVQNREPVAEPKPGKLEDIVRELAAIDARTTNTCDVCGFEVDHYEDCPWVKAREWVESHPF